METYTPRPLDTSGVTLSDEILALTERLAEHNHDIWARKRIAEGWTWGPARDDARKQHPCLVPYAELPEKEKEYDRATALEVLKAILAAGYSIVPSG
jgi:ryanodine receptor 2